MPPNPLRTPLILAHRGPWCNQADWRRPSRPLNAKITRRVLGYTATIFDLGGSKARSGVRALWTALTGSKCDIRASGLTSADVVALASTCMLVAAVDDT